MEFTTVEWVTWFNTGRLLQLLGYVPSAEYKQQFYRAQAVQTSLVPLN